MEELNETYRTIAQITSIEDAIAIHEHFKGLTVNFPTKLIDVNYVYRYLRKELETDSKIGKRTIQEWAIQFNYSERQIRRMIKGIREELALQENAPLPYVVEWVPKKERE